MNKTKELLITSFALFSLFFGAGNLLLPPLLGYNSGNDWFLVTLGFMVTAVIIPIIGIIAHSKIQGTLFDFAKKVSKGFSYVYCILIYSIAIAIPSPRTAAATHEIAIHPTFGTSPLLTSTIYFSLAFVFVLNRSKILDFIGKYLTPFIVIMLLLVTGIGLFSSETTTKLSTFKTPFVSGILEGYQTFDAIAAVVVGGVIIISINLRSNASFEIKRKLIKKSGLIAGLGLFIIYMGLIAVGAFFGTEIELSSSLTSDMQRANLLRGISIVSLGTFGNTVLSVLISLACFTTAVGIITAFFGTIIGVVVGQLNFNTIIVIALPILLFIYPITIVLILLNAINQKYASHLVFRTVIVTTIVFSIPDVVGFLKPSEDMAVITNIIPFAKHSLGWVLPAFLVFVLSNLFRRKTV